MSATGGMRVVMFSTEYPPYALGGLGTHVGALSKALPAPVTLDIVVPPIGSCTGPNPRVRIHTAPMDPTTNDQPLAAFTRAAAVAAIQLPHRPHVVHSQDWMTVLAGIRTATELHVPLVFSVHLPQRTEPQRTLENIGLVAADAVVVNSEAMRRELVERELPIRSIDVVPNGVDADLFRPAPDWPDDDGYLLFAGRLAPQKGVAVLLKAFAAVVQRCTNARLLVVGDGLIDLQLRRLARALGISDAVTFTPWQQPDSLIPLYQRAAMVVMPSVYEPFGLVALEAMACGRPVVVSRTGGLAETVEDEVSGVHVRPGDHLDLARQLARLIRDVSRRHAMGAAARKRALCFSWETVGVATARLYERVCRNHRWPASDWRETTSRLLDRLDPSVRSSAGEMLGELE